MTSGSGSGLSSLGRILHGARARENGGARDGPAHRGVWRASETTASLFANDVRALLRRELLRNVFARAAGEAQNFPDAGDIGSPMCPGALRSAP